SLCDAFPFAPHSILELDITPHRSDALGHVGLARELSALFKLPFALPEATPPRLKAEGDIERLVSVRNQDLQRCPHYGAAAVVDVVLGPSPWWLRWRLHTLGVRPVGNVVDVTNLLLLEFGQPMHAFDLDCVREQTIVIR